MLSDSDVWIDLTCLGKLSDKHYVQLSFVLLTHLI